MEQRTFADLEYEAKKRVTGAAWAALAGEHPHLSARSVIYSGSK